MIEPLPATAATMVARLNQVANGLAVSDPAADGIWRHLRDRVTVDEDLNASLDRTFGLDSAAYVGLARPSGPALLPMPSEHDGAVRLRGVFGAREVTPVPGHSLHGVEGEDVGVSTATSALLLEEEEYLFSPTVSFSQPLKQAGRRTARQHVGPVSVVTYPLPRLLEAGCPEVLTFSFPQDTTTDVVALECRVDFGPTVACLDRLLDMHLDLAEADRRTLDPEVRDRLLAIALVEIIDSAALLLSRCCDRLLIARREAIGTDLQIFPSWGQRLLGLRGLRRRILDVGHVLQAGRLTRERILDALNAAREVLTPASAPFTYVTRIDDAGAADLRCLQPLAGGYTGRVVIESVSVPFTTERCASLGQARVVRVLLLAVAAILGAVAFADTRWLPTLEPLTSWSWHHAPLDPASVRSALVILLLLVPGLLYGTFVLHARPRTRIDREARARSFWVGSVVFAAPVVPATLAATGASLTHVAAVSAILCVLAVAVAIMTTREFSPTALARLRRTTLVTELAASSRDSAPDSAPDSPAPTERVRRGA